MGEVTFYLIIFIVVTAICFITRAIVKMWCDLYRAIIIVAFIIFINVAFLSPHKKYEVIGHFTCKTDYYALYLKDGDDTIMVDVDKEDYYKYKKGDYYEYKK